MASEAVCPVVQTTVARPSPPLTKGIAKQLALIDKADVSYRADIDGLRALAVLSVIAFHVGTSAFAGGFVGVDIFFVISGYLITGTLISDIEASRLSVARFYERRIRRIFPALFAMMFLVCAAAVVVLFPPDLRDFGKSLASAVFSVSNLYFWLQTGYFEPESSTRPLLHTWSLGVEEQFYIVFPLLLAVLHGRGLKRLRTIVLLIAGGSLLASIVVTACAPASAFFLLPTRAWELMTGSILSLGVFPSLSNRAQRNAVAAAGAAMILAATFWFTEHTFFPGFAALLPCAGAALLIGAGRSGDSTVSRVFSWTPVVFIGKISYSLYLWHWPLIAFQRMTGFLGDSRTSRLLFLPVLLVVSTLSWKYVEQPFRTGALRLKGPALFKLAAACSGGMAMVASVIAYSGLPSRFPPAADRVAEFMKYDPSPPYREGRCFLTRPSESLASACVSKDRSRKNYLVLGDSHAAQLWPGLASTFPETNFLQATANGCKPTVEGEGSGYCRKLMQYVFDDYLARTPVDALLIAANWQSGDLPALSATITGMQHRGIKIILFGPIMEYNAPLPRLLADAIVLHQPDIPRRHFQIGQEALDLEMAKLAAAQWHVQYVSVLRTLCESGSCATYAAGQVPLQFDYGHLTKEGSLFLAKRLRDSGNLL